MRTVKLTGELGRKFGRVHRFDVKTPAEAIRALCANFKGFREELAFAHERNVGFTVITGGEELEKAEDALNPASGEIKIIPVIMGANATARIIIGAALIVVGSLVPGAQFLIGPGVALALGGVVELLSPVPKAPKVPEKPENDPSYIFNGPVNTTGQGHPVPLGYGRLIVGGALISAGIDVTQLKRGFIRQTVERIQENYSLGGEENYFQNPPKNYFKKELVVHYPAGENILNPFSPNAYWGWKFYYYETILVEA